jgi:RNA polymerase sigma factor (sigma-70 family)
MGAGRLRKVLEHLLPLDGGGLTDGQLLARFLDSREETAFAVLVRRHGPMVLGVCRRLLGHIQDAEDAFQATFLVLVRKAASVLKREAVGSFLYGVAYRTALRARARAMRRRATERQVQDMPHPEVAPAEARDWQDLLDEALNGLPEKYRAAVVLCDLEGRSRREAARQLRLPEGTLSSRLATARRMLAKRLGKSGLSLSGGALAGVLSESAASAAVPGPLMSATVKAAVLIAAGQAAAVATPAALLMNEVLKAMLLNKVKLVLAAVMVTVALGASGFVYRASGEAAAAADKPANELEKLRRENELLRLNLEVVLEKVKAQEAELRGLRARAEAAKTNLAPDLTSTHLRLITVNNPTTYPITTYPNVDFNGIYNPYPVNVNATPSWQGIYQVHQTSPDAVKAVEDALKEVREARDPKAQRCALEALDKAMKKLKDKSKVAEHPTPKKDPE